VTPLATSLAFRLAPFLFAMIVAVSIAAALRSGVHWRELLPRRAALAACLLFGGYVLLNAAWSADPATGFGKAALLVGLIVAAFATVQALASFDTALLRRAGFAFAAGAVLGALFLVFELATEGLATRTLMNALPSLTLQSPKHVKISAGEVTELNLAKFDQRVNLALFHLWPGLLALFALEKHRRALIMTAFFAVIAAAIALSEHASSQIALIVSSLVVILAWTWRHSVIRALAVVWCAAFVLVIPATLVAYQSGLHLAAWMPRSAQARIIIWEYTAEQIFAHPLLGIGVDSTPVLNKQQKVEGRREKPTDFVYPRTVGSHGHSIFLQSWHELGAIGTILFAIAGASVALLILLLPASAQPFACGAFAAFLVVGAFAWGLWQSWFMGAAALLPIYLRVAAASFKAAVPGAPAQP
jgi:O-antigen ligase